MDQTVDKALDVVDSVYSPQGYNIGFNMGRAAGASIEHIHLHIIPRYAGEIGIAELLAGKRVMVEDLFTSRDRLREAWSP
jgi:ATP adenylyltransferase